MTKNKLPTFEGIDRILEDTEIQDKHKALKIYEQAREDYVNLNGSSLNKKDYVKAEIDKMNYALEEVYRKLKNTKIKGEKSYNT